VSHGTQILPMNISIHAPERGATYDSSQSEFNTIISIHAPERGATAHTRQGIAGHRYFNPRPRAGSDIKADSGWAKYPEFQSTPPSGERPIRSVSGPAFFDFNPRPRAGSDIETPGRISVSQFISIHAPERGATLRILQCWKFQEHFNPRPRAGSD